MDATRLKKVMNRLTNQTVFGKLMEPIAVAFEYIRNHSAGSRVLSMFDFISLGVLRHIQATHTLREQIQALLHLEGDTPSRPPLARSTWSDALSSERRRDILEAVTRPLVKEARKVLPDRLALFPALSGRPVYAMDGTYQKESVHYGRCTPRQGGEDNPKGHGLLCFYDIRLGCPADVYTDTRNRHETALLRDYDDSDQSMTQHKNALWLVDRGFVDAPFWDGKKQRQTITMITRMKNNLCIESRENLTFDKTSENEGVLKDEQITLRSSNKCWRLITFRTRHKRIVKFLTNEFDLSPGLIAFLYSRRWDEEKCFDTWKNDFSQAKAWGASKVAIDSQVRLAIVTSILVAIFLQTTIGPEDVKAQHKQDRRQTSETDGTDRPDWVTSIFRHTSKTSKQVLRFLKYCFCKTASPLLYEKQLRPMLLAYL